MSCSKGKVDATWRSGEPSMATWVIGYVPHSDSLVEADKLSRQTNTLMQRLEQNGVIEASANRTVNPTIEVVGLGSF